MPRDQSIIIDIDEFHEAVNQTLHHLEHIDHAHGMLINMKLKLSNNYSPFSFFCTNLTHECKRHWLTIAFICINVIIIIITLNK